MWYKVGVGLVDRVLNFYLLIWESFAAHDKNGHLDFHQEQVHLIFTNELWDCLNHRVLLQLSLRKIYPLIH